MSETLEYRYFTVEEQPLQPRRMTRTWTVRNRHTGESLGEIEWSGGWRQYVLAPLHSIWSADCLADIIDAIKKIKEAK